VTLSISRWKKQHEKTYNRRSTKAVAKRLSMLKQEYFNVNVLWSDDADKNSQYGANRDRSSVPSNCGMSLPIDIIESSPYKMKETLTK
jgi:hypothetical protein